MIEKINGNTKIYGIIGYPVKHSFSPIMHNAAFSELKVDARYVPFCVKPDKISQAIEGIRALGISGFNVTIPHKSSVMEYLDEVAPIARKVGAVNTVKNLNGRLIGTNTDILGFVRSLKELNFNPLNKKIGLLGAGGSSRALLAGLANAGASEILICNRTMERSKKLELEFSRFFPKIKIKSVPLKKINESHLDLLVNSTSVGMLDDEILIDLNLCSKKKHVVDIIYNPSQTKLLRQAENLGIPNLNGLSMLLYQGCEAFEFWTNLPAPKQIMQKQLFKLVN
tara:strand:- start:576 stop:1421 length:846 start_codon:yes stop_codon:yes gene_type:complete